MAVQTAKTRGEPQIEVSAPIPRYTFADSLDQALHSHVALRIEIVAKDTVLDTECDCLRTWYAARLLDNLSNINIPTLPPPESTLVPAFTAVPDYSILIRTNGGEMKLEGVLVKSPEFPATLETGNAYVIFGKFIEYDQSLPSKVFDITIGRRGIFASGRKDDNLRPFAPVRGDSFVSDFLARTGASLEKLRTISLEASRGREVK